MLYGVSKCHYATYTVTSTGVTFNTPVAMPNQKSIDISPSGDTTDIYADNLLQNQIESNQGYDVTAGFLELDNDFLTAVYGMLETTGGGILELSDVKTSPIALLGQIESTVEGEPAMRYVLYSCKFGRPELASETVEEAVEETNQEISGSASPLTLNSRPYVMYRVFGDPTDTTDTTSEFAKWFTAVTVPSLTTDDGNDE